MSLPVGARLGTYEIVSPLGAGGMGEVYRARDTKLGREVAIKVLPALLAADPERIARFEREAKTLATLNHPNIAQIHGLEDADGVKALVMELVEGPTLGDRVAQGPIPIDEALPIAKQIAEALEAAHDQGIVHRDLKPANIKVRLDGTVKVLDFGLAKAMQPVGVVSPNVTHSPTITSPAMMTGVGVILGTAAYMSPEQARGRAADKRSDVWAFGCVLYEMLTGTRPFDGEDVGDTLANVLKVDPDWSALPVDTPPGVIQLLRVCLRKDPKHRLRDISTVPLAMEGAFDTAVAPTPTSPVAVVSHDSGTSSILWKAAVGLLALTAIAGLAAAYLARSATPPVARFFVAPPENTSFVTSNGLLATSVAISPDGRTLAFTARDAAGKTLLWVRPIDSLTPQPLAGTDNAALPFWSPDSRFIAYTASGKLLRIAAGGGPPQTVCALNGIAVSGRGGTWSSDGVIVFNAGPGPLFRVSSAGGQSASLTNEPGTFPSFLPDGRHVLFYSGASKEGPGVYVTSLDGGESKRLVAADSGGVYATRSGHLLFVRQGTLLAQLFDPKTQELADEPFPIAERVEAGALEGLLSFSVSDTGVLAYGSGVASSAGLQLVSVDRQGKQVGTVGSPQNYRGLDLVADGTRLAVHRHDGVGGDIWLMELSRGTTSRLTFDASQHNSSPIWSPDGRQVVFGSLRGGKWGLYWKPSNNAISDERLIESDVQILPVSWSPDGRSIVYESQGNQTTTADLWMLPLTGDRRPTALLHTQFVESRGQISPDGKWLAYESNETGRTEVYVRSFPSGTGKWQVSTNGGQWARWRRDGRELFYMSNVSGEKLIAVDVKADGSTLDTGTPLELFNTGLVNLAHFGRYHAYTVSPDGQRFLIPRPASAFTETTSPIVVVLNWADGIKR